MTFDQLPPHIQEFLRGKPDGYISFPGKGDPPPQPYVPLRFENGLGPLACAQIVSPAHEFLNEGPGMPPRFGYGRGFARIRQDMVLEGEDAVARLLAREGGDHRDFSLEFHPVRWGTYVCTDRVFGILSAAGALGEDTWCPLHRETDKGIEPIAWKMIDFPLVPLIDYSSSRTLWKVVDRSTFSKHWTEKDRYVYTLNIDPSLRGVWIRSDSQLPPMARDQLSGTALVRRDILELLRQSSVNGPTYDVLTL